ncbi:MAG: hypothetical protein J2P18_03705 [Nocardia sp.]|nr:hypothetical protein [Nocardia sp.]
MAGAFAAGAIVALGFAVTGGPVIAAIGWLGGAVGMFGGSGLIVQRTGLTDNLFSVGVRRCQSAVRGTGVLLESRSGAWPLMLMLAGFAVYGISAWFDWRYNAPDSNLMPVSKSSSTGANFALVIGIVLGLALAAGLVLIVFARTRGLRISLYPTGVYWDEPERRGGTTWFVEWEAVTITV